MIDIIINENITKSDRDILHKLLAESRLSHIKLDKIMATFVEIQASLANLDAAVAAIPAPTAAGITAAEGDTIKAGIDKVVAELTALVTPAP